MTELQANFTLEPQQPINASFELGDPTPIEATFRLNVINSEHDKLSHRDYPDQHPMTAITGLVDALAAKQDTLVAGLNVQINGNVISATDTTYIAGPGISIVGNVISNTQTSAEWGNITGTLSAQTDLWNVLEEKANTADIPTATSDLLNDSGFITLSALTPYATQTWVENKGYLTEIPAEYVTDSELTAKGYQTAADVETAITAKGYITNAALVGYATESYVTTAVGTETTNRQNADNNLQSQIDAITAASDVTDIVGTYAELQAYDTTGLANNSIIKVLQDESRNNETTYYRWVITNGTGTWVLIGEEGPYYTKSEADNTFVPQSRTVNGKALSANISLTASDVGAATSAQGALADTAVQPGDLATVATSGSYNDLSNKPTIPSDTSDLTNGAGYITSSALSGYATETWVGNQGYLTGITSSDVTTALGYTPYNSSNPSGYITSAALTPYALSANLATVATSGSYSDLSNTPTIPTVNNATITFTQGGTTKGTITLNQASNQTIAFDAGGGGGGSYTAGDGIIIENDEISVDGVQTTELSIDTTPTQNSSNLITSGGVYAVLGDIESAINTIRGV